MILGGASSNSLVVVAYVWSPYGLAVCMIWLGHGRIIIIIRINDNNVNHVNRHTTIFFNLLTLSYMNPSLVSPFFPLQTTSKFTRVFHLKPTMLSPNFVFIFYPNHPHAKTIIPPNKILSFSNFCIRYLVRS